MKKDSIHHLRLEFQKMFSKIPNFISSTDSFHLVLWQAMLQCNDVIMDLIIEKNLSNRKIATIINEFHDLIEAIIDNSPAHIHLHISAYYVVILEKIIMRCLEEEHYEVCFNVKRFSDFYFNNISPTP